MDDIKLALLGSKEAAQRLTDAGVLVPCPFCGSIAEIEYDTIEPFCWMVLCPECGVYPRCCETEEEARLAWNTRAPILTPEQMEALERLEASK